MKVGIINVTGYAGIEAARLLYSHPHVKLTQVTGRSAAGKRLGDVFPHLLDMDMPIQAELEGSVDVALSALPHKASAEACIPLLKAGVKVVDISADFRLKSPGEYQEWYGVVHPAPELLEEAVYGLTEFYRPQVARARLVANPGCYPTGALLALLPLVWERLIGPDIIVDAKSGISGAGRGLGLEYHYAEANENLSAYGLDGHRHLPEIVQELRLADPALNPRVTFIPHLIPMTRGILSTCYVDLKDGSISLNDRGEGELLELFRSYYRDEPFVKVMTAPPHTKLTWGNNWCIVYPTLDRRTGRAVIVSCIDNLVKGAAGQAIQNMNLMLGLPEKDGLDFPAVYP